MISRSLMTKGITSGTISGIFLGLFLKMIEIFSGIKVYTLLLNVDYIPVLKEVAMPEIVEFILHLIISIILGIVLLYVTRKYQWDHHQIILRVIIITFFIGVLLYPTTALSSRTPAITSLPAIVVWLFGHILYGAVLSRFYIKMK
jgi:hypothetical protein